MEDNVMWRAMASTAIMDTTNDLLSSNDEKKEVRTCGGSLSEKQTNIDCEAELLGNVLHRQNFAANPFYDDKAFQRRFLVSRSVYNKVREAIITYHN